MKSIVKCLTKSKKLLTLSFNEHVFWKKKKGELNLIKCLMLPLVLLSRDILNEVILFLELKTM